MPLLACNVVHKCSNNGKWCNISYFQAFTGLYRMSSVDNDRRPPRRRQQQFDDPNRYKQVIGVEHIFV